MRYPTSALFLILSLSSVAVAAPSPVWAPSSIRLAMGPIAEPNG